MKYLIFEHQYQGHYLEYIRHLLTYANENLQNTEIHLALHPSIEKHVLNNELPTAPNIHFYYFSESELNKFNAKGKLSRFVKTYHLCKKVSELITKYEIDRTILITAVNFILGLSLLTPKQAHISAIEYIIPRWRLDCASKYKIGEDRFRMWLYANTKQLKNLYLLNDEDSPNFYNQEYNTTKFKFLPDPIDCIVDKTATIDKDVKIVLLHAGCFRKEKGTFDIIEALKNLSPEELSRFKFILCGKSIVGEDNEKAVKEMSMLKSIMDVEFYNDFVDEEFLHSLYKRADYILMPYHNYYQSSGNLGHAASYCKPVVGPQQGLLGQLITKYQLGFTADDITSENIAKALKKILNTGKQEHKFEDYTKRCSPDSFSRIMFSN